MKNLLKRFSITLVIVMMLSVSSVFAAATEKRIEISDGNYVTISNITQEQKEEDYTIYTAQSPVKVTFIGDNLCWEEISYIKDEQQDEATEIPFDVKKCKILYSENADPEKVYDANSEFPDDELPLYVSGNYATLTKPGFYTIFAGLEAEAPTYVIVLIEESKSPSVNQQAPATATATSTSSKVLVNGKAVSFEAYAINGNNYFKLRDVAMAINNTDKNFEVSWDGTKNAINLISSKLYTVAGGELKVSGKKTSQTANLSTSKIYMDGEEINLTAYTIGGSNYFKLRDLASVIDFGVVWDGNTNTIGIDTSIEYAE